MVLRVQLVGSGKQTDFYRVNLPTYSLIHGNVGERVALVSVVPENLGLDDADLKEVPSVETTEGPYYPSLPQTLIDKVHTHFDHAYPDKKHQLELAEVENV